jgi:glycosyltransferase involved in cell wall biosynthesis
MSSLEANLKILLIAPSQGVYGGIEAFLIAIAGWMRAQTQHSIRVCFKLVSGHHATPSLRSRCLEAGLDVHFVERGSFALVRQILWADVVHGNNCSPDIVVTARFAGRPLVLTIHNYLRDRSGWRNRVWYLCSRLAQWRTYNSRFVRDTWELGADSGRSEVIPAVSDLPTELVAIEDRVGFLFIARLIENKGLDVLVHAYVAAEFDKRQWPLAIAGTGPLSGWLEEYISTHRPEGISVLGFLSEAEKGRRIAAAKWLVAPANTNEDMGLTPIEARSVAVPAIVTRDGGLPESGGEAALLCEPGDAVSLRAALERAASMVEEEYFARSVLAKDSLRDYLRPVRVYLDIYTQLASKSSQSH